MTEPLKFEKDTHYRTRRGDKRLCVLAFSDGDALCVDEHNDTYQLYSQGGCVHPPGAESSRDIIGEWREPQSVTVLVFQHVKTDGFYVTLDGPLCPLNYRRFGRATVTEGEGMGE